MAAPLGREGDQPPATLTGEADRPLAIARFAGQVGGRRGGPLLLEDRPAAWRSSAAATCSCTPPTPMLGSQLFTTGYASARKVSMPSFSRSSFSACTPAADCRCQRRSACPLQGFLKPASLAGCRRFFRGPKVFATPAPLGSDKILCRAGALARRKTLSAPRLFRVGHAYVSMSLGARPRRFSMNEQDLTWRFQRAAEASMPRPPERRRPGRAEPHRRVKPAGRHALCASACRRGAADRRGFDAHARLGSDDGRGRQTRDRDLSGGPMRRGGPPAALSGRGRRLAGGLAPAAAAGCRASRWAAQGPAAGLPGPLRRRPAKGLHQHLGQGVA